MNVFRPFIFSLDSGQIVLPIRQMTMFADRAANPCRSFRASGLTVKAYLQGSLLMTGQDTVVNLIFHQRCWFF